MDKSYKKLHILFGLSTEGSLKMMLKEMGKREEEEVISFWDMFSIGPIGHLDEENGKKARSQWAKNVINKEEDLEQYQKQFNRVIEQIAIISEDIPITIWVAENAHEQTGLRYALHLLSNRKNEIQVINMTKAYGELFNRADIQFIVSHSGEVAPEEMQVIYEQRQFNSLSKQEREELEIEWRVLTNTTQTLRIWENGKIKSVDEDYYDQYMISTALELQNKSGSEAFIKSVRLIGEVIGHLEQYVGDTFLEYRLRKLIENGVFEKKGNLKAMRYYSIRLAKK